MKKSELKQLIKEVITEASSGEEFLDHYASEIRDLIKR